MACVVRRIVDASPLILLGKIGRLDLRRVGGPQVVVPGAVLEELGGHEPDDAAAREIVLISWIRIAPFAPIPRSCPNESALENHDLRNNSVEK